MARRKYRLLMGMKEHPETKELLIAGDIFEAEERDIESPSSAGGWQQIVDADITHNNPGHWQLVNAARMADDVEERRELREEPSKVIGFNISEEEFEAQERAEERRSSAVYPVPSARRDAPASVRRRGPALSR